MADPTNYIEMNNIICFSLARWTLPSVEETRQLEASE